MFFPEINRYSDVKNLHLGDSNLSRVNPVIALIFLDIL